MSKSPSPIDFTVPSLVRRKRIHAFLSLTVPFGLTIFALANMGSLSSSELIQLAVLTLMMYCVGQLGITLGFHRLFSHQSFRPNRAITIILGIAGSMTAQGPILNWVSDHRRHHSFGDIPGDPHSPHTIPSPNGDIVPGKLRGFWHAQAGWLFSDSITNMAKYSPDLLRNRLIVWLSNRYFYWVALGLAIPTLFGWWFIGGWRGAALGMLWGGFVRMFISYQLTWATNSINHLFGRHDFKTGDHSTNIFILGLIDFGEGWHNNHHAFPNSARFGLKWWQIDFAWLLLQLLEKIGLVNELKQPTPFQIQQKQKGNTI